MNVGGTTEYSPLRSWWSVCVFCFAALVSYTDRLILSALVDPIKQSLAIGDSAVSLLQGGAFALIYVFSGLVLGRLADRKRRLTILLFGSITWCIGTVACGLASSFWALFLARVVVGVGEASLAPAAVSIIGDSFPPTQRGSAIGIFMLGFFVGGPASIAVGSIVLHLATVGVFAGLPAVGTLEPWRMVLVIVGIGGLATPALLLTLREPTRQATAQSLSLRDMIGHFAASRHSLVTAYLAMALLSIGDYGTLTWVPSVLSRRLGMPAMQLGEAFGAVTAISGVLGCVLGGVGSDALARRWGTRGRLVFSLGAAGLAAMGAGLLSGAQVSSVLAGLGLWTFSSGLSSISGIAAVQSLAPDECRGVGISLVAFCNTLVGLGVGPTLVALVTEHVYGDPASVGIAITTIAAPAGALAAMLFLYSSRGAQVTPQPQRASANEV